MIAVQENVRGLQLQLETKNREISDLQCDLDSLNDLVDSQLTQIGKLARVWYVLRVLFGSNLYSF